MAMDRRRSCLNCGCNFMLNIKANKVKHPYCYKEECQEARKDHYKRLQKEATKRAKKRRAEGLPIKVYRYNDRKSRISEFPIYTGKNCIKCRKPVKVVYPSAGHAGIYNRRCEKCNFNFNRMALTINEDFMFVNNNVPMSIL